MISKIQKWGNSLGIRIPKSFALEASVTDGSDVDIAVYQGRLIIRPLHRYRLETLLAGITKKNLPAETNTGDPVGREIW